MKPIRFSTVLGRSNTLRVMRAALTAPAFVLTLAAASARAEETDTAGSNWIGFTIGGAFISGDDTGFMRRTQTNGDFYGGIDSFRFSKELNDSTTLTLDGHALPGLEDYEFNMDLEKTDIGYLKAGYRQFRTWYDASSGFSADSITAQPFGEERSIDRGEFFLEAGLRMEKLPEITFSYKHAFRNGDKDSLAWGQLPVDPPNPGYKLVAGLWGIDEQTDTFELDVAHTLGNTDLGLGLVYEHFNSSDFRMSMQGPNQTTFTDSTSSDLFAANIHSVTRFNDKVWLTFGCAYNTIDTDLSGGSRSYAYGAGEIPGFRDYSYNTMSGGGNIDQIITNLNLMWNPVADLTVTPSLRYEHEDGDVSSKFNAYNTLVEWQGPQSISSNSDTDSTIGALDIRYTGLSDLVLYAKGQWGSEDENITHRDLYLPGEWLRSDIQTDEQEYILGANWYALKNLSFSIQGIHRERDASLDHTAGNEPKALVTDPGGANDLRPLMLENDLQVDDFNIRMTWRPLGNVSLVTRYDYSHSEIDNRGLLWRDPPNTTPGDHIPGNDPYATIESGEITSNILSQSVTWNPMVNLYLQGSVSYISSETDTPASKTAAIPATTPNWDNDYLTASLMVGYAIDAKTDITAGYTYYGASNYQTLPLSMGYGLNTEEHAVNVTLTRVLTKNMIWNLRYGFITSNTDPMPDQTGGFNDFSAHMVSTGLQVRF